MFRISKDSPAYYPTSTARRDEPMLVDIDQVAWHTRKRGKAAASGTDFGL